MQQPSTQTVYDLFNGRIQFQVPVYQRAYIWNQEENWSILWEDIVDTVDRYLAEPEAHSQHRHFLGPIVLTQQPSEPGGVDPRMVIDGQQRLTTLQILLSAAASVAKEHGCDDVAKELSDLNCNHGRMAVGDLKYKVRPSRRDRDAFIGVIEKSVEADDGEGLPGAWSFFRDRIEDWVSEDSQADPEEQIRRMQTLQVCLESLLYVVSINLDETDNAQVIFETLNARGTGLGALDLVKNATFLQAERDGVAADSLHDNHWEPTFEADDYWLADQRQGREKRARADWFLMHWLAMELGQVVRADKLFDTFRRKVLHREPQPRMEQLVPRLCEDARIMRSFDDFEPGTSEALFFSRMEALDTTTMLPIALLLFRSEEVSPERRRNAMWALESWLVRRAVLRNTAKNYNRTLAGLLTVVKGDLPNADEAVVRELRSSQADTAVWPSDAKLRERLEQGNLYSYISQARVRMLLDACELDIRRSAKTEAIPLPAGLTIEHALPQAWQENWDLPPGPEQEKQREVRQAHVERLGNLTLVTQSLNSSMSNAAWIAPNPSEYSKRDELVKRSVLLINQRLCQNDEWNERRIDDRGAELTQRILAAWPGPDSDVWPVTTDGSAASN